MFNLDRLDGSKHHWHDLQMDSRIFNTKVQGIILWFDGILSQKKDSIELFSGLFQGLENESRNAISSYSS